GLLQVWHRATPPDDVSAFRRARGDVLRVDRASDAQAEESRRAPGSCGQPCGPGGPLSEAEAGPPAVQPPTIPAGLLTFFHAALLAPGLRVERVGRGSMHPGDGRRPSGPRGKRIGASAHAGPAFGLTVPVSHA